MLRKISTEIEISNVHANFRRKLNCKRTEAYSIFPRDSPYRFDGPSPTIASRMVPHKVRCGGRIARGNLPGTGFGAGGRLIVSNRPIFVGGPEGAGGRIDTR